MLNRRHIRTIVVQSIYSNLVESIDDKDLKNYINKRSSSCLDLFYCMVDYLKEINLFFNNLESQRFSCPFVSSNPYFFFFTKLNAKSFKRKQIIDWDLNHNYIIEIQDQIFDLNKEFLESKKNDEKSRLEFEYTVFAHTANLDDGSKPHKMAYSILRPLDDTPLDECWDNCLAKFQELFESK